MNEYLLFLLLECINSEKFIMKQLVCDTTLTTTLLLHLHEKLNIDLPWPVARDFPGPLPLFLYRSIACSPPLQMHVSRGTELYPI